MVRCSLHVSYKQGESNGRRTRKSFRVLTFATSSRFIPKPQSIDCQSKPAVSRDSCDTLLLGRFLHGSIACTPLDHVTMLVLDNIKRMYTIDTLDARFISSRQTSVDPTSTSARSRTTVSRSSERKASSSQQADRPLPGTNASRWRSPEYIFYVIAFFSALSWMFKVAIDVSKRMLSVTVACTILRL